MKRTLAEDDRVASTEETEDGLEVEELAVARSSQQTGENRRAGLLCRKELGDLSR